MCSLDDFCLKNPTYIFIQLSLYFSQKNLYLYVYCSSIVMHYSNIPRIFLIYNFQYKHKPPTHPGVILDNSISLYIT